MCLIAPDELRRWLDGIDRDDRDLLVFAADVADVESMSGLAPRHCAGLLLRLAAEAELAEELGVVDQPEHSARLDVGELRRVGDAVPVGD